MNIYIAIDDKKRENYVQTFYKKDEALFKKLNGDGWGIYFAVNSFNATQEQMDALGAKTARHNDLVTKLRYVYADLDIAKTGDGLTREAKQARKGEVFMALLDKLEPTIVIETSNGLQPLWELEKTVITEETKKQYVKVIQGIIAWSKTVGCKADAVQDIARVLRLPEYYHHKEEPFLCVLGHKSNKKYTLDFLEQVFPFEEVRKVASIVSFHLSPVDEAIQAIDFQELMVRAFQSTGRTAEFDKTGRLILDGRQTGTFQGRKDDRGYLASSSHEPFKGNRITATADILGITNKEARKWIIDQYGLDFSKLTKQKVVTQQLQQVEPLKIDYKRRYTWGTRGLDTTFAIIKRTDFIVVGAKRGNGKTTFTFDMATKNARLGHNVLYISLEMSAREIKEDFARKYAGVQIDEELDYVIPEHKQSAFEAKIKEIESIQTLYFEGVRRSYNFLWESVVALIDKHQNLDMVFIDNLDKIGMDDGEDEWTKQKRIVNNIMSFTDERQVPIILIHHHRKSMAGKDFGMDELSGSGKIADAADRVVMVIKNHDPLAPYPQKYETKLYLQKARGYREAVKNVYFIRGTFLDDAPLEYNYITSEETELINKFNLVV